MRLLLLVLLLPIIACSPPTSQTDEQHTNLIIDAVAKARLDSTLQAMTSPGGTAAASVLIFEKGKEVYYGSSGYADREAGVPMDRKTIVQIYSMTKPVTGTALMQLHEKGLFDLDDPIERYIPELAGLKVYAGVDSSGALVTEAPHRPMSIRDLTRHTAGFYNGTDVPALYDIWQRLGIRSTDHSLTELAEKLGQMPLLFQPGTEWHYGPSVDMQALLVERLSGQPFADYLRKNVLDPLGMQETRYRVPPQDQGRMASVYERQDKGELVRIPDSTAQAFNIQPSPLTPGGWGLTSTLDDYQRFARMLVNRGSLAGVQILEEATVALMATNQLAEEVKERLWLPAKGQVGFGINFAVRLAPPLDEQENPGIVGEFFWDGAASTLFWVDPVNQLTVVFFTQLFPYDPIGLHHSIRSAVYG